MSGNVDQQNTCKLLIFHFQTLQQVLSEPGITLEQAQMMVSGIEPQIDDLHKSTFSCY